MVPSVGSERYFHSYWVTTAVDIPGTIGSTIDRNIYSSNINIETFKISKEHQGLFYD